MLKRILKHWIRPCIHKSIRGRSQYILWSGSLWYPVRSSILVIQTTLPQSHKNAFVATKNSCYLNGVFNLAIKVYISNLMSNISYLQLNFLQVIVFYFFKRFWNVNFSDRCHSILTVFLHKKNNTATFNFSVLHHKNKCLII